MKVLNIRIIFVFIIFSSFAQSSFLLPEEAVQAALTENLKMPEADPDGRVQTLNKKGAMSPQLDQISQEFVEFSASPDTKVLEIGAGYGLACLKALDHGAQDYTANDLDIRHLKILALQVKTAKENSLSKIRLLPGGFSEDLSLPDNYYDAILIARVLHFMSPDEIRKTLDYAYKVLKPKGRIYAVMLSPYVKGYQSFIPEFEKRIQEDHPFPGYVENLRTFADEKIIPKSSLENMEKPFFFFNKETAINCFEQSHFVIEKTVEMPLAYESEIWQLDGRENIGLVAYKPENTQNK